MSGYGSLFERLSGEADKRVGWSREGLCNGFSGGPSGQDAEHPCGERANVGGLRVAGSE